MPFCVAHVMTIVFSPPLPSVGVTVRQFCSCPSISEHNCLDLRIGEGGAGRGGCCRRRLGGTRGRRCCWARESWWTLPRIRSAP